MAKRNPKKYPTPQEAVAALGHANVGHYTSEKAFIADGGSTKDPFGLTGMRYIVTTKPAGYRDIDAPNGPFEAMDNMWDLFENGGWTAFVWDAVAKEGWSYNAGIGPGWLDALNKEIDRRRAGGSAPAPASAPVAPPAPSYTAADIGAINNARYLLGMGPINVDDWSVQEIIDMAKSVRSTGRLPNPKRTSANPGKKGKFKRGDIVQYTAKFLRSIGKVTRPEDGIVVGHSDLGASYPIVMWSDAPYPVAVNEANLELDKRRMEKSTAEYRKSQVDAIRREYGPDETFEENIIAARDRFYESAGPTKRNSGGARKKSLMR